MAIWLPRGPIGSTLWIAEPRDASWRFREVITPEDEPYCHGALEVTNRVDRVAAGSAAETISRAPGARLLRMACVAFAFAFAVSRWPLLVICRVGGCSWNGPTVWCFGVLSTRRGDFIWFRCLNWGFKLRAQRRSPHDTVLGEEGIVHPGRQ